MSELWLVRHGETPWNQEGRLTGWSDVPLTALGEQQARALSGWLAAERFERVVASDLQRAIQTARLAYGEPQEVSVALRELEFGQLEGLKWAELPEAYKAALLAFDGFQAPGGESTAQLRCRVYGFFDRLPAGRHLVFTHGGVLRMVLRELDQDRFLPPCAVVGVDWAHKRVRFVRTPEDKG
ncbi:MAG: alpha-ribazole-5'-phosphate phosphatase [Meiothermus sp.]|uniref:histidine phosphatase family protein n=1 Tax=Meiothermus sp. TaxID=1955249 RepID=UPI0021DF3F24|nr:histidine phosphatase family protein [Meiothermus sp.]GIW29282.1 MAG: alpha-ribazole-5'-phosphate phosphatase [Meiothermus sp.]